MRFRFWSSARAAMLGGDGMYHVGPPPQPAWLENPSTAFFARRLGVTFEMLFHSWLCLVLEYDPQLLLEPPSFERDFRRSMEAWARRCMRLSYAEASELYYPYQRDAIDALVSTEARIFRIGAGTGRTNFALDDGIMTREEAIQLMGGYPSRGEMLMVNIDFESVERRALADFLEDKSLRVEPLRPQPAYLQHDPTKNVRRRRRK
jgi:hypothetical protein